MGRRATSGFVELLTETRKLGPAWSSFDAFWAQPPPSNKPSPAILIVHTIRGVTDHERSLARAFAELGFVAVVPDLYSHAKMQVPPEDAAEVEEILRGVPFQGSFVPGFEEALRSRSRQDQERLRKAARVAVHAPDPNAVSDLKVCVATICGTPGVDAKHLACLGMSMGGGYAWTLATVEPRVAATVVFYGRPLLPFDQLDRLKGPVLAVHAGEDTRLTDLLPEVEAEMSARGRSFTHITYPGVHHGFLNPKVSVYHEACARDALQRALAFLKESFGTLPAAAEKAVAAGTFPSVATPPQSTAPPPPAAAAPVLAAAPTSPAPAAVAETQPEEVPAAAPPEPAPAPAVVPEPAPLAVETGPEEMAEEVSEEVSEEVEEGMEAEEELEGEGPEPEEGAEEEVAEAAPAQPPTPEVEPATAPRPPPLAPPATAAAKPLPTPAREIEEVPAPPPRRREEEVTAADVEVLLKRGPTKAAPTPPSKAAPALPSKPSKSVLPARGKAPAPPPPPPPKPSKSATPPVRKPTPAPPTKKVPAPPAKRAPEPPGKGKGKPAPPPPKASERSEKGKGKSREKERDRGRKAK